MKHEMFDWKAASHFLNGKTLIQGQEFLYYYGECQQWSDIDEMSP